MKDAPTQLPARKWLDRAWWAWLAILLIYISSLYRTGFLCHYAATDFRGYYASAQIAWQHGFTRVYDQPTQDQYQTYLPLLCPDGRLAEPLLRVTMPYLPAFVLLLLPLPVVEFSISYVLWTLFNLILLALYSWHFCHRLAGRVDWLRLFQWAICLPLLATLSLGQTNVFLVVCLGEFCLAFVQGKEIRGGLWLGGMLIKPHILILFLPGLVLGRRWKTLAGFLGSCSAILAVSYLLAGVEGLKGMLEMINQFASPAFETAPTMMNWRSLALNLQAFSPTWLAWGIALGGMLLVAGLCLHLWRTRAGEAQARQVRVSADGEQVSGTAQAEMVSQRLVLLILATYAATCSIAWHAHFYILLLMVPLLIYLDGQNKVPTGLFALWVWGPPLWYLLLAWASPDLARNGFGLGMLGLNLVFFAWARSMLRGKIA